MKSKIIKILFVAIAITGVGAIMAFSLLKKSDVCLGTELHIKGSQENKFVTIDDVNETLNSLYLIRPGQTKTNEINTERLETLIKSNAWVNDANVYFSQGSKLLVEVTPKVPELRIFNGGNISYYLDSNANGIPLSASYVADVPLFTIDNLKADLSAQNLKLKMLHIARAIKANKTYDALIEQIHVETDRQFVCYTNMANHKVVIGDTNDLENKLARLAYFYGNVMPRKGWDAYNKLDLSYASQVVAERNESSILSNPIKDVVSQKTTNAVAAIVKKKKELHSTSITATTNKPLARPILKEKQKPNMLGSKPNINKSTSVKVNNTNSTKLTSSKQASTVKQVANSSKQATNVNKQVKSTMKKTNETKK